MKKIFTIIILTILIGLSGAEEYLTKSEVDNMSLSISKNFAQAINQAVKQGKDDTGKYIIMWIFISLTVISISYIFLDKFAPKFRKKKKDNIDDDDESLPLVAMKYIEEVRDFSLTMDDNFRQVDSIIKSNSIETIQALSLVRISVDNNSTISNKLDATISSLTASITDLQKEFSYIKGKMNGGH